MRTLKINLMPSEIMRIYTANLKTILQSPLVLEF